MWYMKLQFLFNNISISLIFLFDPVSSDTWKEFFTSDQKHEYDKDDFDR